MPPARKKRASTQEAEFLRKLGLRVRALRTASAPTRWSAGRSARSLEALTLEKLAERTQVAAESLSRIENGHAAPRMDTMFRLASALGVRVSDLLPQDQAKPNQKDVAIDELVALVRQQFSAAEVRWLIRLVREILDRPTDRK